MTKTGQDKSASLQAFVDRAHVQRDEQEQVWLATPIARFLARSGSPCQLTPVSAVGVSPLACDGLAAAHHRLMARRGRARHEFCVLGVSPGQQGRTQRYW